MAFEDNSVLNSLHHEKNVSMHLSVYKLQFPNQPGTGNTGAHQRSFVGDRVSRIREVIMETVPHNVLRDVRSSFDVNVLGALEGLSMYGFIETCCCASLERNGLGNIRSTEQGKREVALISYTDLLKVGEKLDVELTMAKGIDPLELGRQIMVEMTEDAVKAADAQIYHCVVDVGEVLVVPMGFFQASRVVPITPKGAQLTAQEIKMSHVVQLHIRIQYFENCPSKT